MDFKNTISKIKKTAIDTASTVAQSAKESSAVIAKKSEELVEISKLTVSISSQEAKIQDMYAEIGKQLCEKHEHGIYVDPDLVESCNEVIKLKTNVKNIKDTILQLKSKKRCTECEDIEINSNTDTINDQETISQTEIIVEESKDTSF